MSKDLLHTHARRACTCRVWLSLHLLFSAYPLLGTYLLTTYTYKRIHLLTRVDDVSTPILDNHIVSLTYRGTVGTSDLAYIYMYMYILKSKLLFVTTCMDVNVFTWNYHFSFSLIASYSGREPGTFNHLCDGFQGVDIR